MGKSTIIFWQYNRYCNRKMAKYILNFNQEKALNNTFQEIYSESQNSWHFPDIITHKKTETRISFSFQHYCMETMPSKIV